MAELQKTEKVKRHLILDHPLAGYLLLFFLAALTDWAVGKVMAGLFGRLGEDLALMLITVIASAVFLGLYKFRFRPAFKGTLTFERFMEGVKILAVPILLSVAFNLYSSLKAGLTSEPFRALWMALTAGVGEEVMYRTAGISNYMRVNRDENKIPLILWFSGLLFGLTHFVNLKGGAELTITVLQVISATGVGLLFAAVCLRTANIWPCILSHTLVDFACFLSKDLLENTGIMAGAAAELDLATCLETVLAVPMAVIAVMATGKKYRPQIIAVWDKRWSR